MKRYAEGVQFFLGSADRWPAIVGSLPTVLSATNALSSDIAHSVLGELPSTASWQPALRNPKKSAETMSD